MARHIGFGALHPLIHGPGWAGPVLRGHAGGSAGFKPFVPWVPPVPPPGSYDPALATQYDEGLTHLGDLQQDTSTGNARNTTDYEIARGNIQQGLARTQADLGTSRSNEEADYQRNIAMLTQNYQRLGGRQGQQDAAYGVLSGGAVLQAARKRTANMAQDRAPIDTARTRFLDANTLAGTRAQQDANSGLASLALRLAPPGEGGPLGGRAFQDSATALARGTRDTTNTGLGLQSEEAYQAAQNGWDPSVGLAARPSNEFGSGATAHRVIRRGNTDYIVNPAGRVIGKRPASGR